MLSQLYMVRIAIVFTINQVFLKDWKMTPHFCSKLLGRFQVFRNVTDFLFVLIEESLCVRQNFVHFVVSIGYFGYVLVIICHDNISDFSLFLFEFIFDVVDIVVWLLNKFFIHAKIKPSKSVYFLSQLLHLIGYFFIKFNLLSGHLARPFTSSNAASAAHGSWFSFFIEIFHLFFNVFNIEFLLFTLLSNLFDVLCQRLLDFLYHWLTLLLHLFNFLFHFFSLFCAHFTTAAHSSLFSWRNWAIGRTRNATSIYVDSLFLQYFLGGCHFFFFLFWNMLSHLYFLVC